MFFLGEFREQYKVVVKLIPGKTGLKKLSLVF